MKKIDWYIIRKFLGTFFYAITILAVIACVIDYSEKMDDLVSHKTPAMELLNYFKNFIPHISALLFPLFIFIATIFFTSKMAYRSEVIAILSSGVSYQRFLRPYIIGGSFLCLLSLWANHYIVPAANKQRIAFEDKFVHGALSSSDHNVHIRLSKNLYVYLMNYDYKMNIGYQFTAETIDGVLLKNKVFAEKVNYDTAKKAWNLFGVHIQENDGIKEKVTYVAETTIAYPFKPIELEEDNAIKEALTTPELNRYIAKEKLRGRETLNFFYIEKYRRTAQPFAALVLTIIGVCISSKRIRGGSGLHLALGIVISSVYIMTMQFSNTFSTKAGLNPLIAVWIPNLLFGTLALWLYRREVR